MAIHPPRRLASTPAKHVAELAARGLAPGGTYAVRCGHDADHGCGVTLATVTLPAGADPARTVRGQLCPACTPAFYAARDARRRAKFAEYVALGIRAELAAMYALEDEEPEAVKAFRDIIAAVDARMKGLVP